MALQGYDHGCELLAIRCIASERVHNNEKLSTIFLSMCLSVNYQSFVDKWDLYLMHISVYPRTCLRRQVLSGILCREQPCPPPQMWLLREVCFQLFFSACTHTYTVPLWASPAYFFALHVLEKASSSCFLFSRCSMLQSPIICLLCISHWHLINNVNKQKKKKIQKFRKQIFTITSKKYLEIKSTKDILEMHIESYKTWLTEIKDDLNKWRNIQ